MAAARKETRRQIRVLRELIREKEITQVELNDRLEWNRSKVSLLLNEKTRMTQIDLFLILEALGVPPAEFYARVYAASGPPARRGLVTEPVAAELAGAAESLRGASALAVGKPDFTRLYVPRGWRPEALLSAMERVRRQHQPLRWFVAGQPGGGLTTEIGVLTDSLVDDNRFLPCLVGIEPRELSPGSGTEVVLTRALENATALAEAIGVELSDRGQRVEALEAPATASRLARLLETVAEAARNQTGRELLLIVAGLEHLPSREAFRFFEQQLDTLLRPAVSQIVVIPLFLLVTRLEARFAARTSLLPPIPVTEAQGLAFYDELIGRYLPLRLIHPTARRNLASLSAGIVGDMLALTGEACERARLRVGIRHVEQVAARKEQSWGSRLRPRDRVTLSQLLENPFRQDSPTLPNLVRINAVTVQSHEEGLAYHVHPAIRRLVAGGEKK
jgi:transcriptional regulator with XRE-family HTH domain